MSKKSEFLNKYYYLDIGEYETNEEMQDMFINTSKEKALYDDLYQLYVSPLLEGYEDKGYELDTIIFRGFVKNKDKSNVIIMLFDGLDKSEVEV